MRPSELVLAVKVCGMEPNCLLGRVRQVRVTLMPAPGRPMVVSRTWQEIGDGVVAILKDVCLIRAQGSPTVIEVMMTMGCCELDKRLMTLRWRGSGVGVLDWRSFLVPSQR